MRQILDVSEGVVVALWYFVPLFIVIPVTTSPTLHVVTLVGSLIGLFVYLSKRVVPLPNAFSGVGRPESSNTRAALWMPATRGLFHAIRYGLSKK